MLPQRSVPHVAAPILHQPRRLQLERAQWRKADHRGCAPTPDPAPRRTPRGRTRGSQEPQLGAGARPCRSGGTRASVRARPVRPPRAPTP
eukprot:9433468-Alexandrium_andersonii.AAC.1